MKIIFDLFAALITIIAISIYLGHKIADKIGLPEPAEQTANNIKQQLEEHYYAHLTQEEKENHDF